MGLFQEILEARVATAGVNSANYPRFFPALGTRRPRGGANRDGERCRALSVESTPLCRFIDMLLRANTLHRELTAFKMQSSGGRIDASIAHGCQ